MDPFTMKLMDYAVARVNEGRAFTPRTEIAADVATACNAFAAGRDPADVVVNARDMRKLDAEIDRLSELHGVTFPSTPAVKPTAKAAAPAPNLTPTKTIVTKERTPNGGYRLTIKSLG